MDRSSYLDRQGDNVVSLPFGILFLITKFGPARQLEKDSHHSSSDKQQQYIRPKHLITSFLNVVCHKSFFWIEAK